MHLVHPALVHFAITLLLVGALLEASGILAGRERMERYGSPLLVSGILVLVPTVASGFLARNVLDVPFSAARAMDLHERAGILLLGLALGLALWKGWNRGTVPAGQRTLWAAALLLLAAAVVATAWLGGTMVYGYGVGTSLTGG